ncbi:hypothetical protein QE250_17055 [Chromatiaceae bacterium AAb-1]|nr:hypothetical protein [Chromatiaceae bacterium AAb-1]
MLFSFKVSAELEISAPAKVIRIVGYSERNNGDVVVEMDKNSSFCSAGYWLRRTDPGFDTNLSLLLSAYHAKNNVILRGEKTIIWKGSAKVFCYLDSVEFNDVK